MRDLSKCKAGWKVSLSLSAVRPSSAAAVHTSVSTANVAASGTVLRNVWEDIKVKNKQNFGYVLSTD